MAFRPQPFGRYELLDRISAGGMAEVFRARDKDRDHVVALKRILPEVAEDEEFIAMFEDEARIVSTLEHPHIARALDFGQHESEWFIAFEYVEGRDMRKLWNRCVERDEHPPLAVLLYIFARVGEGLAYAHARKDNLGRPTALVHRDVSPQNIVVSFDGDVKLIDFGIAKAQGKLARTQAGTIKGKFGYMAPEQVRGLEVDQRADVFALGVCLWELLTLKRLFTAENELKILEKIRTMTVPPPSSVNADVPAALDEIVLHSLAKNVDERYRAAKELYRELNVFSHDFGEVATREEVANYMRHAFPEAGKSVEESRVGHSRTKGGRRSSAQLAAVSDPYQPGHATDSDFATTGVHDPNDRGPNDRGPGDRGPNDGGATDREDRGTEAEHGVFEGLGKTSAHRALSSKPPGSMSSSIPRSGVPTAAPGKLTNVPGAGNSRFAAAAPPPSSLSPSTMPRTLSPAPSPAMAQTLPIAQPQTLSVPTPAIAVTTLLSAMNSGRSPIADLARDAAREPVRTPPPPPGRGSLPSVSAMVTAPRLVPPPAPMFTAMPPHVQALGGAPLPPPQAPPRPPMQSSYPPPSAQPGQGLPDLAQTPLDWDDDDVSTNILDRPADLFRSGGPGGNGPQLLPKNGIPTLLGLPGASTGSGLPPPAYPRPVPVRPIRTPPPPAASSGPDSGFGTGFPGNPPPSFRPPMPSGPPLPAPRGGSDNPFLSQLDGRPTPLGMPDELPTGPIPVNDDGMHRTNPTLAALGPLPMPSADGRPPNPRSRMEATLFVNRQSTSVGLRLGIGIAAAIGLTIMVLLFFAGPKTGRLVVNVTDAKGGAVEHLEVFVDGKKSCDTTPCYADQLSAGLHEVKVLAEGFDAPAPRGTTIESRKDTTVAFTLVGNARGGSGVRIAGNQPGVKLYVDGSEVGPLPQDIRTLPPGEHRLRLAGSDRYAPLERTVTLGKDEVQDLGQQMLKVIRGKATIASAPSGAKVYIVSGTDRHELPSWPMSVDIDTSKQWWLEAVKPGFSDYQQLITFDDGQAEKSFVIDLQPKSAAPPVVDPDENAGTSPGPVPVPRPAPHRPSPVDNGDDTSSPVASGEGYLNINSVPASSVVLDGKPIGQTPQVHVTVSAGSHQIVFVNADQGLKKQVTVTVGAGETKVAAAKLRSE